MAKRPSDPPPLSCLQDYLNQVNYRPRISDLPNLNSALLDRARNSIRFSRENNDLLEFLGDRVLNLMSAVLVEEVQVNREHHVNVRRVICNNDTFGRLSFYLRLHEHAKIDPPDVKNLDDWNPLLSISPPKALADLFEAYAGAVYLQYGWNRLFRWLQTLFEPIIKVATGEWWYSPVSAKHRGKLYRSLPEGSRAQWHLSAYLYHMRDFLASHGKKVLDSLPASTVFSFTATDNLDEPHSERMEVGIHLINMWICDIIIKRWPVYRNATSRAAHIASAMTGLIVNDISMSYLGYLISLISYLHGNRNRKEESSVCVQPYTSLSDATRRKLALVLKATVGWFYYKHPEAANAWGRHWLEPVVYRAHEILIDIPGFKPSLPPGVQWQCLEHQATPTPSLSLPKSLSDFFDGYESNQLSANDTLPPSTLSISNSNNCPSTQPSERSVLVIRQINADPVPTPTEQNDADDLSALTQGLQTMGLEAKSLSPSSEELPISSSTKKKEHPRIPLTSTTRVGVHSQEIKSCQAKWRPIGQQPASDKDKENFDQRSCTGVEIPKKENSSPPQPPNKERLRHPSPLAEKVVDTAQTAKIASSSLLSKPPFFDTTVPFLPRQLRTRCKTQANK